MLEMSNPGAGRPTMHHRGFRGFKNEVPIQYALRCCRDMLIQATLDRHVQAISPSNFDTSQVKSFFAIEVTLADRRGLVALTDRDGPALFHPPEGYSFGIKIAASQVCSDPLKSNARLIWSCRERLVPADFHIRVTQALGHSRAGLTLSDLRRILSPSHPAWLNNIFTMVATGSIELGDLAQFAEGTRVFPRLSAPKQTFFANLPGDRD